MPTAQRTLGSVRHNATTASSSASVVPIVIMRVTPAALARDSTSGNCDCRRGSVRWQCESITSASSYSKRRFEGVLGMADLGFVTFRPDDRDDVEPARRAGDAVAA